MSSKHDQTPLNWSVRGPTRPRRSADGAGFGVEALEPRSLLAGSYAPLPNVAAITVAAEVDLGAARPVDSQRSSYVIVSESAGPHDTPARAQSVPTVPFFGVVGNHEPDDPLDLFRVAIAPGATTFELTLASTTPLAAERLSLLDATGQVLGEWSSADGSTALSVRLAVAGGTTESALYIGISSATPAAAFDYQLWVARQSAPAVAVAPRSVLEGPGASEAGSVVVPASALPFHPAAPARVPGPEGTAPTPMVPLSGGQVAAGAFPTRSAGPSGGVLAEGGATLPVARRVAVTDELEWSDGLAQTPEAHTADVEDRDAAALVVWQGPGGFPILGAAPLGSWRPSNPTVVCADVAEPATVAEEGLPGANEPAPCPHRLEGTTAVDAEPAPDEGRWSRRRASLATVVTVALAWMLNDLVSAPAESVPPALGPRRAGAPGQGKHPR